MKSLSFKRVWYVLIMIASVNVIHAELIQFVFRSGYAEFSPQDRLITDTEQPGTAAKGSIWEGQAIYGLTYIGSPQDPIYLSGLAPGRAPLHFLFGQGASDAPQLVEFWVEERLSTVWSGMWVPSPTPIPPTPGMQQQISAAEYAALMDLYTSTDGKNWSGQNGWADPNAIHWDGVYVSGYKLDFTTRQVLSLGTVTTLDLANLGLRGSIPESLGNLVSLQHLNLNYNPLNGNIPESLGNLLNLQELILEYTGLSGSLPSSLGKLVHLRNVILRRNPLSGSIPESFGNLVSLQELILEQCELTGSIPESLGKLSELLVLNLESNRLTGSIPESFGNLQNLGSLRLDNNQLSGDIPENLSNLAELYELWVNSNCFDISPGSDVRTVLRKMSQAGVDAVIYRPQNLGCGPVALVDLNNDGCVDQDDLGMILNQIRSRSKDLTFDLNGDGKVDVADARFLVLHFTNADGTPCPP